MGFFFGKKDGFKRGMKGQVLEITKDGGFFGIEILMIEMIKSKIDFLFFRRRTHRYRCIKKTTIDNGEDF